MLDKSIKKWFPGEISGWPLRAFFRKKSQDLDELLEGIPGIFNVWGVLDKKCEGILEKNIRGISDKILGSLAWKLSGNIIRSIARKVSCGVFKRYSSEDFVKKFSKIKIWKIFIFFFYIWRHFKINSRPKCWRSSCYNPWKPFLKKISAEISVANLGRILRWILEQIIKQELESER